MKRYVIACGFALAMLGGSAVVRAEGASAPAASQSAVAATAPAPAPAVVAPPMAVSAPATTESAFPAPTWVVVLVFGAVLGFLLISLSAVRRSLANDPDWKLAHALSEELDTPPPPTPPAAGATGVTPPVAPVLVGSSSRLIAFMGMLVIMAFFTGVGLWLLWSLLRTGRVPADMERLVNFFYGGAMLFAPYMVNQLRAALGSLK